MIVMFEPPWIWMQSLCVSVLPWFGSTAKKLMSWHQLSSITTLTGPPLLRTLWIWKPSTTLKVSTRRAV